MPEVPSGGPRPALRGFSAVSFSCGRFPGFRPGVFGCLRGQRAPASPHPSPRPPGQKNEPAPPPRQPRLRGTPHPADKAQAPRNAFPMKQEVGLGKKPWPDAGLMGRESDGLKQKAMAAPFCASARRRCDTSGALAKLFLSHRSGRVAFVKKTAPFLKVGSGERRPDPLFHPAGRRRGPARATRLANGRGPWPPQNMHKAAKEAWKKGPLHPCQSTKKSALLFNQTIHPLSSTYKWAKEPLFSKRQSCPTVSVNKKRPVPLTRAPCLRKPKQMGTHDCASPLVLVLRPWFAFCNPTEKGVGKKTLSDTVGPKGKMPGVAVAAKTFASRFFFPISTISFLF